MISFSEAQIYAWITPILWPFLRTLAVFTSAPVLSSRAFPVRARIALAFFVALAVQPSLADQPLVPLDSPEAFGTVVQQVGIGLSIGFAARLVVAVMELAGQVVGFQMGLGFAAFFDNATSAQSSAMGRFYGNMAILLFIALNGHLLLIMAVVNSFAAFPVDQNFLQAAGTLQLHTLGTELFASGFWIALPVVAMLMFANLALGIISRVAPQMNIFAIGFPVTLGVGLLGVTVMLPLLEQPYTSLLERVMELFVRR